jgi:hypothetical protein
MIDKDEYSDDKGSVWIINQNKPKYLQYIVDANRNINDPNDIIDLNLHVLNQVIDVDWKVKSNVETKRCCDKWKKYAYQQVC